MHTLSNSILLAAISIGFLHGTVARDIPQNIKTFYNNVKAAGTCKSILKGGLADTDDGPKSMLVLISYSRYNVTESFAMWLD